MSPFKPGARHIGHAAVTIIVVGQIDRNLTVNSVAAGPRDHRVTAILEATRMSATAAASPPVFCGDRQGHGCRLPLNGAGAV
jgi:hypothetical protein